MSLLNISASISVSEEERTRKLLEDLRDWCDEEHGRRAEVARFVGVERQVVTHWLTGRQEPTRERVFGAVGVLEDFVVGPTKWGVGRLSVDGTLTRPPVASNEIRGPDTLKE